jgi:hypothetical protein
MRRIGAAVVAGCALLVVGGAARGELITTLPQWNGTQSIFGFGETNTATFGQTFAVGADPILQSFAFRMRAESLFGPFPSRFGGYLMAWDEANGVATGPVLWSSGPRVVPIANPNPYQELSFAPNVLLDPGGRYVFFVSASAYFDGQNDQARFGLIRGVSVYAGGNAVFLNNGADTSRWTTQAWLRDFSGVGDDFAFEARLAAVPEPSGLALAGIGAATALLARRRARSRA